MIRWNKLRENSIVIIFYTILTTILTYPVIFKIRTHIAGSNDAWQVLWMFWHTKMAILNPSPNLTLSYINYIFYPNGILLMPFGTAFNQLLSIPLQSILGLGITYNILWVLSFILGGYGTYLLVKYLTADKIAAFIAGIIFAFCPYHFAHALGHMGATTIEWIPFCALYLMKMTREKSLKNAVYAAIFFILVAMSDLQYMVYMVFFIGLLFIYEVFSELRLNETFREGFSELLRRISSLKELLIKFMVFASVSFVGILPLTYHMIKVALSPSNFLKPSPYESIYYSADLLGFFIPSALHPLFGGWLSHNVYKFFTGNIAEYTTYIGYTVLILSLYAVITLRKRKEVRFWALSTLFFILMSLGPILHICGKTQFTVFKTTIPLPYIIVYYLVPFVNNGRTLGRFDVLVMLSFAVLAGYGISNFIKRFDIRRKRNIFVCVLTALLIFEFLATPCVISFVDRPVFYKQISEDTENYALLEIPATKVYGCGIKCEYYQTIHGKPIVGGQVARTPAGARDFELNTPLVRQLTYFKLFNDIFNQNATQIGQSILNYYNIRYIILHEKYMTNEELEFAMDLLNKTLKNEPKEFKGDNLIVYKIEDTVPERFMVISEGWNALEKWNDGPGRWMSNSSGMKIISPKNEECYLSFETGSFYQERDLYVYINNKLIEKYHIDLIGWPDITPTQIKIKIKINKGENTIRFYTPQKGTVPSKVGAWKDSRCLSLAFQNIALTPVKKNYDVDFTDYSIPDLMDTNSFYSSNITIKNMGTEKWNKNGEYPVYVSYHWLKGGKVVFWDGIRNKLPCDVTSGNTIEMNMNIEAPHEEGNYTLIIDLVKECVTWFGTQGAVPLKKNVTVSRYGLKQISKLEYQTEYTEVNELKKLIESVLESSATSFDGKCGRVYGFYAGSGYPQIWVRDSATIIPITRYFYSDEFIRAWIEEFLINQAENGSIEDYISPLRSDKNTVETDQETSLVYSAYQYYKISGNKSWLLTEINGKTIIYRLDGSLRYVLKYRCNSTYGLVIGAYTADWGDVQFEDSPGTDITNKTHWTCDIYDNAMFYRACEELSMMYSELGEKESATFWSGIAQSIEENANKCLWQPDKGFYKMHVRLTPLNLDFTESDMFPMGGNAMAVRVGLANHTQASQIFKVAEERKKVVNATTIGCVLYPPYPDGFFANPIMDEEHEYQNGGQWDWFAGRLILAEFENGFSEDAVLHLKEISKQDISAEGLYEWYTLNGTGKGSSNYTGSAGVLGESIIKGYFGVYLSHDNLEIKPRLGDSNGSIYLYEPATDIFISYNYSSFQNSTIILTYESNFQKNGKISVLIPDGKTVSKILIDDTSVPYSIDRIGNDTYVSFIGDFKQHECEIILA